MSRVPVTVDGVAAEVPSGATLLQAADAAGVYVPRLCAHPALATRGQCGVCAVEVAGRGVVRACETPVAAGVSVATASPAARVARLEAWGRLLAIHPHACLACDLREGCSRSHCSLGVPGAERCCERFGACEFQKVATVLGVPADAPAYVPRGLPGYDEGLFTRRLELCIGCGRCRDACADLAGVGAVGGHALGGRVVPRPARGGALREAGCVSCGACVQVCPTGALSAASDPEGRRWLEESRRRLALPAAPEPPRPALPLDRDAVAQVGAVAGVYRLVDGGGRVLKIRGVMDLRQALEGELAEGTAACFAYEPDPLYTARESRWLQQHLAEHGSMPGGDEDLF